MTPFEKRTPLQRLMYLGGVVKAASGKAVEDTATGNPLTFTTDLARPLKSLKANFLPIQSGTGDPSPTNIRPITGWTGLDVMHGADQTDYDTYPVTWTPHGTIYGGDVDLVTGEVWAEYALVQLKWSEWTLSAELEENVRKSFTLHSPLVGGGAQAVGNTALCNVNNYYYQNNNTDVPHYYITSTGYTIYAILPKTLNGDTVIQVSGKLKTPVLVTTLTPQQINAIKGNNTVWSDGNGDCEVTYLKKG